jgi:Skp family chaperone for outer membrane proteins
VEERIDSRHRQFQRENQGLQEELANLQAQLHQQELQHNQELAIAIRGINRNTGQIGAVAQQLENPINHPQ